MSALNSVMLYVMQRPNLSLLNRPRIYDVFDDFPNYFDAVAVGVLVLLIVIGLFVAFFYTNLGQAYIATGDNESMAKSFGIHTENMKILGLVLSNGLIALAGVLIAQNNGYADVNSGLGIIVGSVLYQLLLLAVIRLGLYTTYIRIFSSTILAICLMIPTLRSRLNLGALIGRGEANE